VGSAEGRILNNMLPCATRAFDERPSIFIRGEIIFSSEKVLHKNFYYKVQLKISLQGLDARRNDWQ
jgi:hypothetical protein